MGWAWAPAAAQTDTIAQHFICTSGYNMEKCVTEMAVLRKVLAKYPIAELGEWTWVLIRSEDWKSVVLPRGISPDSPAFTSIEKRATFIEQALVTEAPERRGELMKIWRIIWRIFWILPLLTSWRTYSATRKTKGKQNMQRECYWKGSR